MDKKDIICRLTRDAFAQSCRGLQGVQRRMTGGVSCVSQAMRREEKKRHPKNVNTCVLHVVSLHRSINSAPKMWGGGAPFPLYLHSSRKAHNLERRKSSKHWSGRMNYDQSRRIFSFLFCF